MTKSYICAHLSTIGNLEFNPPWQLYEYLQPVAVFWVIYCTYKVVE